MQEQIIDIKIHYGTEEIPRRERDYELLYIIDGNMAVIMDQEIIRLAADDILLVNSEKKFETHKTFGTNKKCLWASLCLSREFLCRNLNRSKPVFWCSSSQDGENANYEKLRGILKSLIKNYAVGSGENNAFIMMSNTYQLLHILTNNFMIDSGDEELSREEKILAFLNDNYREYLSLDDVADHMALSSTYVSRYFKKQFGTNFVDYLYQIRLDHAQNQLVTTDSSMTDIAMENGFPNVQTFNRHFKEKYMMTPSEYRRKNQIEREEERKQKEKEEHLAMEALQAHLGYMGISEPVEKDDTWVDIIADAENYRSYKPIWNDTINVGAASNLLHSNVQEAIAYAKQHLDIKYVRIWSLFDEELFILNQDQRGRHSYARLDQILNFLMDLGIRPVIELGEKPDRIRRTTMDDIKAPSNKSLFISYEEFLETLDSTMKHLVNMFSRTEVNRWGFEVWDDRRIEVYEDKKPYMQVYTDVRQIVHNYARDAIVGGAGNYIGWYGAHTDESVRRWVDYGVYPDFLTFTYAPYASANIQSEHMSKRKSDENDLSNALDELNATLKKYGFPTSTVYISYWNMTGSSRNYFNDSLWKGCYIVKSYIDNIGKVDGLAYSQLLDTTTDYYDDMNLINGSGGVLTRDIIEKPAFMAMRLMKHLQKYLIDKGENYIITRSETGKITIMLHNFTERNYRYFLKEEDENTLQEHYTYFDRLEKKKFHFTLNNVFEDTSFHLHHHLVNRNYGSIMDIWASSGFDENIQKDDIEYMKRIAVPRLYTTSEKSQGRVLEFDVILEPLEFRCISIRPM